MLSDLEKAALNEAKGEGDVSAVVLARLTSTPLAHVLGMYRSAQADLDAHEASQPPTEGEEQKA